MDDTFPQRAPAAAPACFAPILRKQSRSDGLTLDDRKFLQRWADDPRTNELWDKVQTKLAPRLDELVSDRFFVNEILARFFINEILAIRRVVQSAELLRNQAAAYRLNAERAEKLANFLDPKSSWPPPPVPSALKFVPALREAARELRRLEDHDVGVSRKDQNGSRERVMFMRDTTELFIRICGRPLDDVVAALTDIAFPGHETTLDQVRSARRPSTSKGRRARSC
jgi:hypothetical protein